MRRCRAPTGARCGWPAAGPCSPPPRPREASARPLGLSAAWPPPTGAIIPSASTSTSMRATCSTTPAPAPPLRTMAACASTRSLSPCRISALTMPLPSGPLRRAGPNAWPSSPRAPLSASFFMVRASAGFSRPPLVVSAAALIPGRPRGQVSPCPSSIRQGLSMPIRLRSS